MHPLHLIGAHTSACDVRFPVDPLGRPGVALEPIPAAVVGTIYRACRAALPVFSRSKNSNLSDGTGTAMWSDLDHLAVWPASTKSTYWGTLSTAANVPGYVYCVVCLVSYSVSFTVKPLYIKSRDQVLLFCKCFVRDR